MGQTVHGFNPVLRILHLGEIHLVPVVLKVPGPFPQILLEKLGADDDLIAPLQVFLSFKIFEDRPEEGSFGMVDDQPRASLIVEAERSSSLPNFL